MQLKRLALVFIAIQAVTPTGWAHHSHGNYQMTQYTELDGTVIAPGKALERRML